MGEYATYGKNRIKIGTCEDMYYLRADQAHAVTPLSGNVRPASPEDQKVIRFRFPWPDEDGIEPGQFKSYDRALTVPGVSVPTEVEHMTIQFSAPVGYLVSLPCPEGRADTTLKFHHNGFAGAVQIVQQAYRHGNLAVICRCAGCHTAYNLPTWAYAEPLVVALRAEADRDQTDAHAAYYHAVADRIAAGYAVPVEV